MRGSIGSTAGKAVARGTGKWGLIAIGTDGLGQYSACRCCKLNALYPGWHPGWHPGWQLAQLGGEGIHQRSSLLVTR
jgi:hypothetical protein